MEKQNMILPLNWENGMVSRKERILCVNSPERSSKMTEKYLLWLGMSTLLVPLVSAHSRNVVASHWGTCVWEVSGDEEVEIANIENSIFKFVFILLFAF